MPRQDSKYGMMQVPLIKHTRNPLPTDHNLQLRAVTARKWQDSVKAAEARLAAKEKATAPNILNPTP